MCDDAVEPVWKEQAFRRILGTVGDVEDLSRRATVGDRVIPGRKGRNVGEAAKKRSILRVARVRDRRFCNVADAMIIHILGAGGAVEGRAQVGDHFCLGLLAVSKENGANETGMIGLDRENSGGIVEDCRARDQRRRPMIGGDADVFENVGAEEETHVVRERVDIRPKSCGAAERREASVKSIVGHDIAGELVRAARAARRNSTCLVSSSAISAA